MTRSIQKAPRELHLQEHSAYLWSPTDTSRLGLPLLRPFVVWAMEVDDAPVPPVDTVENTDIASLVESLYEYTPRDLKALLVPESAPNRNLTTFPSSCNSILTLMSLSFLFSALHIGDTHRKDRSRHPTKSRFDQTL